MITGVHYMVHIVCFLGISLKFFIIKWWNKNQVELGWHLGLFRTCVLSEMGHGFNKEFYRFLWGPGVSDNKESTCNGGDLDSIPGWGRSPGGGHGNSLQYSYLENPMDSGAWRATIHGVTKRWTRLKKLSTAHIHTHTERERTSLGGNKRPWASPDCCFQVFTSPALVFTTKWLTTVRSIFQASALAGFGQWEAMGD